MKEQERLEELTEQTAQKVQEAATLDKKIEKVQKQQLAVQNVEKIEAKAVPFSSKVMLERSEYESLATAAKKYVTQEKKERHLQKLLDAGAAEPIDDNSYILTDPTLYDRSTGLSLDVETGKAIFM